MGPAQPVPVCPSEPPPHFFLGPPSAQEHRLYIWVRERAGAFPMLYQQPKERQGPIVAHVLLSVALTGENSQDNQ
jgi:hypothetical protein